MAVLVIAQARMGSSRLPGKVMLKLNGIPVIHHILKRLLAMREADAVCIATSKNSIDDIIEEQGEKFGVPIVRGSENDVLSRFAVAAEKYRAETIVRVTCDCPLIDPSLCDQLVRKYKALKCDYASIGVEQGWPQGLDCEVFSADLLRRANNSASYSEDREHVTPWIIRNSKHSTSILAPMKVKTKWVLDYEEDYIFLNEIFQKHAFQNYDWLEVLDFLNFHKELVHKLED